MPPLAPISSDTGDRRHELNEERRTLRAKLQEFDAALATVDRWQRRSFDFVGELHFQVDRLKTLDLLGPERDGNTDVCPMCTQPREHPDPSARDIARLTDRLSEELEQAAGVQPVRQEHRQALQAQRDSRGWGGPGVLQPPGRSGPRASPGTPYRHGLNRTLA